MKEDMLNRFYYDESRSDLPLRYKEKFRKWDKGDVAGCLPTNEREYAKVKFNNATLAVHMAVWIYFYGKPDDNLVIDHINGDKMDNRISNLRLISNDKNKRRGSLKKYKSNSSGMTGIVMSSCGKWKVSFRKCGVLYYFGVYSDIEEAKKVCINSRLKYFPESIRP